MTTRGAPVAGAEDTRAPEDRQGPAPAPRGTWGLLRPLLLRIHFYAGVLVGPFLLVTAVTGALYVYTPQLDRLVYAHQLYIPAAPGHLPLQRQVALASARVPGGTVSALRPAPTPTDTTQVIFDRPDLQPSFHHTVFVDPHTGAVRGALRTYGSSQALPVRTWFDQLHRGLHLGDAGRLYSELAASWLWVIVAGGVALWLGRRRSRRPSGRRSRRGRLLSWHGTVGLSIAAALLFLSATGLSWSQHAGANIDGLRAAVGAATPEVSAMAAGGGDVGPDAVRASALRAGLNGPVEITPPRDGSGYVVHQIREQWPQRQDSVAVDPGSGRVTGVLRFADYPLLAKLTSWGIAAHMGMLFGVANQVVLTVVALGLACLLVWGYRMWWLRRPTRGRAPAGRPPARGAWRALPGRILAPLLVAVAAAGYFLPLFGISLVVFVVVDVALGALALRSSRSGVRR